MVRIFHLDFLNQISVVCGPGSRTTPMGLILFLSVLQVCFIKNQQLIENIGKYLIANMIFGLIVYIYC